MALEAGLSEEVVDAFSAGRVPHFPNHNEAITFEFVSALHRHRRIADALYAQAVEILGQDAVIDLVGLAGYYTLISMTIDVFQVSDAL